MEVVVRTHQLSKHYQRSRAVDDVNLPIRMMTGLVRPAEGHVKLFSERALHLAGLSDVRNRLAFNLFQNKRMDVDGQ